jgi:hypothetical protein
MVNARERLEAMYKKIEGMSDVQLESVWNALSHCDNTVDYDEGISMDDWAISIDRERTSRASRKKED